MAPRRSALAARLQEVAEMTLLAPYRVVDLSDGRGAFAGFLLAQLGAEVVLVERPGAPSARHGYLRAAGVAPEEASLEHWAYNRGKCSVVLDPLGNVSDAAVLARLLDGADVLIESLDGPDRVALGLLADETARRFPGLVHVSITGFGVSGPKAAWRSTDLTAMAAGGYLSMTGDDDRPPVRMSLDQAFHHAAADAAGAALIALRERHRSGRGQHVDASAQASLTEATQTFVLAAPYGAPPVKRVSGGTKLPPFTLRLVQACRDGHVATTFLFGPSIGPFSKRLMEWIWEEGYCDRSWPDKDWVQFAMHVQEGTETVETFEAANEVLTRFLATKTKAELLAESLRRRLLIAPVTTVGDVASSEQLASRGYWETVHTLAGPVRFPGPVAKLAATPLAPPPPAPLLGADTARYRAEPVRTRPAPPPPAELPGDDRPLSGIKVLDFTWAMAGPAATRVLADYGATVVRIESSHKMDVGRGVQPFVGNTPGVDSGGLFLDNNAGKLGLAIDLANPAAREVVLDLVAWADVVCESFSPRAMRGWSLDYETLRAVNGNLIMLSSCLMGQTGPLASFAGFGNLAAAISGFHAVTGWPDRAPSGPYGAYTDYVAPRITVAVLLAALDHRARTGTGQYIDFSQAEASLHLLAPALLDYELSGRELARTGNRHPELCPHGVFRCAARGEDDDRWIALAVEGDAAWERLASELGRPDLAGLDTPQRRARADELEALVDAWTARFDEDDLTARLQQIGVAAHSVQNSPELWADPQLAHRGHFTRTDHAVHPGLVVEASRFVLSRSAPLSYGPPPTLGQHVYEVLHDLLGYDDDRIADIAATGALE